MSVLHLWIVGHMAGMIPIRFEGVDGWSPRLHTQPNTQTAPDTIPIATTSMRSNSITAADMSNAIERALLDIREIF